MIVSMAAAGIASQYAGPRAIGLVAGSFGLLTALAWACYDWSGRLTEPAASPEEPDTAETGAVDAHWT